MNIIRATIIVIFILLVSLLSFELYRNWDYSYTKDNSVIILVYSILSIIIFITFFFSRFLYKKLSLYIKINRIGIIKSIYIKYTFLNPIIYFLNDLIIIYSFRKNEPKFEKSKSIIDLHSNRFKYMKSMNDWHINLISSFSNEKLRSNSEMCSYYIELGMKLKYPTRFGEMTPLLYSKYLKSYYRSIRNILIEINRYYFEKRKFDYILYNNIHVSKFKKYIIMRSWFKIVVSLFLVGVLYLGWEYVQVQKQMALNGRYQISCSNFGYRAINTNTGEVYYIEPKKEIP
jgi:hypothetical protein